MAEFGFLNEEEGLKNRAAEVSRYKNFNGTFLIKLICVVFLFWLIIHLYFSFLR